MPASTDIRNERFFFHFQGRKRSIFRCLTLRRTRGCGSVSNPGVLDPGPRVHPAATDAVCRMQADAHPVRDILYRGPQSSRHAPLTGPKQACRPDQKTPGLRKELQENTGRGIASSQSPYDVSHVRPSGWYPGNHLTSHVTDGLVRSPARRTHKETIRPFITLRPSSRRLRAPVHQDVLKVEPDACAPAA